VRSVKDFGGVEHRLEVVCEKDGILYINDSKATNVDSVWYALESMNRPVVWIAGGTDKGNDYEPLKEFARQKVKALICMGLNNEKLKESFFGLVSRVYDTNSLEQTMKAVREIAAPGDVVLLSPACASFDLFSNYEDRGRKFKEAVKSI
jgi:UDP-N-acetylmuramoylalanine--D-glutamate ligase